MKLLLLLFCLSGFPKHYVEYSIDGGGDKPFLALRFKNELTNLVEIQQIFPQWKYKSSQFDSDSDLFLECLCVDCKKVILTIKVDGVIVSEKKVNGSLLSDECTMAARGSISYRIPQTMGAFLR